MAYKPVGIDEQGKLPPRARTALAADMGDAATELGTALSASIDDRTAGASYSSRYVGGAWEPRKTTRTDGVYLWVGGTVLPSVSDGVAEGDLFIRGE